MDFHFQRAAVGGKPSSARDRSRFSSVLTWECVRFAGVVDPALRVPGLDTLWLAWLPFVWQTMTSAYIVLFTKDDKRAALAVWLGTLGFGAQIFPAQRVLDVASVAALEAARPGLATIWAHGTFGLIWLLNWSTFGASLRARDVVSSDADYVRAFLTRPSAFWFALFALDLAVARPFASIGGLSRLRPRLRRRRGPRVARVSPPSRPVRPVPNPPVPASPATDRPPRRRRPKKIFFNGARISGRSQRHGLPRT